MGKGSWWVILATASPFESPMAFIRAFQQGLRWECTACGQGWSEQSLRKTGKGKEDTLVAGIVWEWLGHLLSPENMHPASFLCCGGKSTKSADTEFRRTLTAALSLLTKAAYVQESCLNQYWLFIHDEFNRANKKKKYSVKRKISRIN